MLSIPIALLVQEGIRKGFLPFEKIFLCSLWLLPSFFVDLGEHYALPLTPPMLIGLIFYAGEGCNLNFQASPCLNKYLWDKKSSE
jgi:hypothetical protein